MWGCCVTDIINRADVERMHPICLRLWPIIQQHPPGSAGRTAITRELNGLPADDRHICDQLLDRMERVIRFEDAWFPFYQGEVPTGEGQAGAACRPGTQTDMEGHQGETGGVCQKGGSMSKPKEARERKQAQRSRDAALGIKRVEMRLSIREREQLETLRSARAGSGEPSTAPTSTSAPCCAATGNAGWNRKPS